MNIYTSVFTFLESVSTSFVLTSQHYRSPSLASFFVYHVHRRHFLTKLLDVPLGGPGLEAWGSPA